MPTFTIVGSEIGYGGGNYKNEQPGQAAKKAGKALFKKLTLRKYAKYKNRPTIKFILRMRDRHSAGKTYSYMVTRVKLAKPLLIKKGPIEYEVKYDYKIETCNLSPVEVQTMTGGDCSIVGGRLTVMRRTKRRTTGGEVSEEFGEEEEEFEGGEVDSDEEDESEDAEPTSVAKEAESPSKETTGGKAKPKAKPKAKAHPKPKAPSVKKSMSKLSLK
jgi:hypothetical protein